MRDSTLTWFSWGLTLFLAFISLGSLFMSHIVIIGIFAWIIIFIVLIIIAGIIYIIHKNTEIRLVWLICGFLAFLTLYSVRSYHKVYSPWRFTFSNVPLSVELPDKLWQTKEKVAVRTGEENQFAVVGATALAEGIFDEMSYEEFITQIIEATSGSETPPGFHLETCFNAQFKCNYIKITDIKNSSGTGYFAFLNDNKNTYLFSVIAGPKFLTENRDFPLQVISSVQRE